ncbi:hypothetical protein [Acinetobacter phage pB23]|nr:hypothetical protein [Acinetobacter phage pB23]
MDVFAMKIAVDAWVRDLKEIGQAIPEMFNDPVKFALDLGGTSFVLQAATLGKVSPDFAKHVFNAFTTMHKNDIINLDHAIKEQRGND